MDIDGIKKITRISAGQVYEPAKPASDRRTAEVRANLFQDQGPEPRESAPVGEIDEIAAEVQIQLKRLNTELRFDVDNDSGETTIKILDVETGDVIRQIPSEDLQALRKRMDALIGVLYKAKA